MLDQLLYEAKKSQEKILAKSIEKIAKDNTMKNVMKINERKNKQTFEKYYTLINDKVVFNDPLSYCTLEQLETCDDHKFKHCIDVLKTNDCHIYDFEIDETQKEFDIESYYNGRTDNKHLFNFVCRLGNWFFRPWLKVDNEIEEGIFGCKDYHNVVTGEKFNFYCDLFGNNVLIHEAQTVMDFMKSSLTHSQYLEHKWHFLNLLSEQLNQRGYVNQYIRAFELFPEDQRIQITEPINITLSYSHFPEQILSIVDVYGKYKYNYKQVMKMKLTSLQENYLQVIKMLEKYRLYVKNQYGAYENSKYLNDQTVVQFFKFIKNIHMRNYYEYWNHSHGSMKSIQPNDSEYSNGFSSKYQRNGLDLMNGLYCDISYRAQFGEYLIKPFSEPIKESKSESESKQDKNISDKYQPNNNKSLVKDHTLIVNENVEDIMNSLDRKIELYKSLEDENKEKIALEYNGNGHDFEIYTFNVKIYEKNNEVITEFTIRQESAQNGLKNTVIFTGTFNKVFEDMKKSICSIYEVYNMPLNLQLFNY